MFSYLMILFGCLNGNNVSLYMCAIWSWICNEPFLKDLSSLVGVNYKLTSQAIGLRVWYVAYCCVGNYNSASICTNY